MSDELQQWAKNGWLRPHKISNEEISALLEIVERDLLDAEKDLSLDWKFGIAYNAALKLCTILLSKEGYRPEKNLAHYRTLQSLPHILKSYTSTDADYLDACRKKRNTVEYDYVGAATKSEVEELIIFAKSLHEDVLKYLKR